MRILLNIISILSIMLLCSCSSLNNITYLQESNKETKLNITSPTEYKLRKGDMISVKIFSANQNESTIFNVESNPNSTNPNTTIANLFLSGFEVNSKGNIEIPNIGSVHVENKTIEETKASIQTIADEYLIGSTVVVKHLNFEITILGEVNQPGTYPIYKQNITILEALGISGDLTDYANRKEIIIVRENSRTFSCDLTSSKLLESEAYYLQPRDVVYVQPTGSVVFRKSKIQLLFSGITSISVMLSVVLKVMGII